GAAPATNRSLTESTGSVYAELPPRLPPVRVHRVLVAPRGGLTVRRPLLYTGSVWARASGAKRGSTSAAHAMHSTGEAARDRARRRPGFSEREPAGRCIGAHGVVGFRADRYPRARRRRALPCRIATAAAANRAVRAARAARRWRHGRRVRGVRREARAQGRHQARGDPPR